MLLRRLPSLARRPALRSFCTPHPNNNSSNNDSNNNNNNNNNNNSNSNSNDSNSHNDSSNSNNGNNDSNNSNTFKLALAAAVGMTGLAYASVPLYKLFCRATGFGGTVRTSVDSDLTPIGELSPLEEYPDITVRFNADVSANVPWRFTPCQREVRLKPGEPALAFYTVRNPTDEAVVGVSTYNITPQKAGVYFAKVQCFCFEDQRLEAGEEVDMPVLFYIDPLIAKDPTMEDVRSITLSYTFFKSSNKGLAPV